MKIPHPAIPRKLEPLANLARVATSEDELDGVEITGETLGSETLKSFTMTGSTITSVKGISGLKGAKVSPDQLVRLAPYLAAEFGIKIAE